MEDISFDKYRDALKTVRKEREKRLVVVHLMIYIVVNLAIIVMNLTLYPEMPWYIFTLVLWGLGLLIHFIAGVLRFDKDHEKFEEEIEKVAKVEKKPKAKETA